MDTTLIAELLQQILDELKKQGDETRAFRSSTEATMASVSAQANSILNTAKKISEPYTHD